MNSQLKKLNLNIPRILAISIFMEMLDTTVLNTALPKIAADLGETPLNMQAAIVSYVLTLAVVMPLSGFLSDRFGTRKVYVGALALFALGSALSAMAHSLDQLVISRVIQAGGGALMNPVGRLIILKSYSRSDFLSVFNYAVTPALIGPVLGPLVGGYVVDYLSWHWIFLINIPVAVVCIFYAMRYIPDYRNESETFDFKGFLIFGAGSLFLAIALEELGHPQHIVAIVGTLFAGILMLYLYYLYAKKNEDEHIIFPISLFDIRTYRVGIFGNIVTRLGISSMPLLIPLLIQVAFRESATVSGWIVAPMALMAMVAKRLSIKILNRFSYRTVLRINTASIGLLILSMAIPGPHASIYVYVPMILVLGFFNAMQFTAMNSITLSGLTNENSSAGNSLLSVNQQLAIGFGISFGALVLRFWQKNTGTTPEDIHQAFRFTFITVGLITVMAGLIFRRLAPEDGRNMRSED